MGEARARRRRTAAGVEDDKKPKPRFTYVQWFIPTELMVQLREMCELREIEEDGEKKQVAVRIGAQEAATRLIDAGCQIIREQELAKQAQEQLVQAPAKMIVTPEEAQRAYEQRSRSQQRRIAAQRAGGRVALS